MTNAEPPETASADAESAAPPVVDAVPEVLAEPAAEVVEDEDVAPKGLAEPDVLAEPAADAITQPVDAITEPVAEPDVVMSEAEPTLDERLAAAIEPAREAAVLVGGHAVGEHLGVSAEATHVATHAFAAALPGYVGWYWAVTVARTAESQDVTVDEVVLLPGDTALLAPAWVPWDQRVRPGDLSPGDVLPPVPGDVRIVPAYLLSDDPAVEAVAFELGLGREQVMSREGRLDAAERWESGDRGPDSPMARQAPERCGTCAFFLPLAGSLQAGFGVCGNEVTDCDGQVVSVAYGCGAHSQARAEIAPVVGVLEVVYDDGEEITVN